MLDFLRKALGGERARQRDRAAVYQAMLRREAHLGGQLFGPVARGNRREFFCLDKHTWVWHEEWVDSKGVRKTKTTRYDVRPTGVLKAQDGLSYQQLSNSEAVNLRRAIELYYQHVVGRLYGNLV